MSDKRCSLAGLLRYSNGLQRTLCSGRVTRVESAKRTSWASMMCVSFHSYYAELRKLLLPGVYFLQDFEWEAEVLDLSTSVKVTTRTLRTFLFKYDLYLISVLGSVAWTFQHSTDSTLDTS